MKLSDLPVAARLDLFRYTGYGWNPWITCRLLNRLHGLHLTFEQVEQLQKYETSHLLKLKKRRQKKAPKVVSFPDPDAT